MTALAISAMVIVMLLLSSLPVSAAASAGTEQALRNALESGGEIKLTKSIETKDILTVPSGKTVVIDLNGKTLDRGLSESIENGSVILVESGAVLTITDSSNNPGVITGGAAFNGGGISNYGMLTIENGVISGNKAIDSENGLGGGIYNAEGASLIVKGGKIADNRARRGGGVYNAEGAVMTVLQGTYKKKVGTIVTTVTTNANITSNKAMENGDGIYNSGEFRIQDSPFISDNGVDIYLGDEKTITFTGLLNRSDWITVMASDTNAVITSGFKSSGAKLPSDIFASAVDGVIMQLNSEGEIALKNNPKTTVQTFSGSDMISTEDFDDVKSAWDKAVSYAKSGKRVEITLGTDWVEDVLLVIPEKSDFTLDLNGRYIKRDRKKEQISDGEVFLVEKGATFTIKDSNPKRKSYEGLSGGVITGGASSDTGGGIELNDNTTLNMFGGTIYECVTCYDGGAINMEGDNVTVNMKNSRINFCQTIDSTDECFGGGIHMFKSGKLLLENVTIEDCYSEDNGGAMSLSSASDSIIRMKNVVFTGNSAYDYGGAIRFNLSKKTDIRLDGCTFTGNKADKSGGAIYFQNSESETAIIFNDCTFKSNSAKRNGSAFYVKGNGIALTNCTVTDNKVDNDSVCGAIYIEWQYSMSVGGLTVIKDNKTNHNTHKDLVLEGDPTRCSSVYSTGLEEGSYIALSLYRETEYNTKNQQIYPVKNVSRYQQQYFHLKNGTLTFEKETTINVPVVIGSAFGEGLLEVLIISASILVIILVVALIIRFRNKKQTKGEQDNESNPQV